ncbi:TolC family protein [uncultured Meiothermus sp.]|uniref:TolC family protein n=1 Tax=uncultured Meiothermus sp. TaxID=157471 RepID=UPI00260E1489|nr:TolC family protein [uncultured Meiothermus sp.]
MRRIGWLLILGLANLGTLAQGSLSLVALLARPQQALNLQLAQANVDAAEEILSQLRADPTTLKADLLIAQSSVAEAQANLIQARLQNQVNLAQAVFNVVAADQRKDLDQARLAQAQVELGVARERVRLGSGTNLAVEQAQAALTQAQQDLRVDEVQLGVQRELLRNLLGLRELPALDAQVPATAPIPNLNAIRAASLRVPAVLKALGTVEVAKLKLDQSQTESTPLNQRSAARQALLSAQLEYQFQVQTARQTAEQAYIRALSTQAALEAARAALNAQEAALKTAQSQERAGTVSRLQVQALMLGVGQTRFAALQAQQAAYLARLQLELTAPQEVK